MLSNQEVKDFNEDLKENVIEQNNEIKEIEKSDIILEKNRFKIDLYSNKIIILQKEEEESELLYIEMFFALRDFTKYLDKVNIKYDLKIINFPKIIINLEFTTELTENINQKLKKFYENLL